MPMPNMASQARVRKVREARRASGEVETNVWVPAHLKLAIDRAVQAGKFPNRRLAIVHALECAFAENGKM
jgi:hypothetical protein